jgi:site-specific recombinase XerD
LIDIPYYTGLRRAEILRCTFENFKSPTNQFEILGKGGYIDGVCFNDKIKDKVVFFEQKLREYTKNRPIENDFIFVGLNNRTR